MAKLQTEGSLNLEDENENLTVQRTIRFSMKGLKFAESKAKEYGLTLAAYARKLLAQEPIVPKQTELNAQAIYQLSKIGTNLNQLAKLGHRHQFMTPEAIEELRAVNLHVAETIDRLDIGQNY